MAKTTRILKGMEWEDIRQLLINEEMTAASGQNRESEIDSDVNTLIGSSQAVIKPQAVCVTNQVEKEFQKREQNPARIQKITADFKTKNKTMRSYLLAPVIRAPIVFTRGVLDCLPNHPYMKDWEFGWEGKVAYARRAIVVGCWDKYYQTIASEADWNGDIEDSMAIARAFEVIEMDNWTTAQDLLVQTYFDKHILPRKKKTIRLTPVERVKTKLYLGAGTGFNAMCPGVEDFYWSLAFPTCIRANATLETERRSLDFVFMVA